MMCCRSPCSWRRSPESTPSLDAPAHPLKIAQSHALRGDRPHAIDHLANACCHKPQLPFWRSCTGSRADTQAGARHLAPAQTEQLCCGGIEAWAKYQEHVTRELEAALELAEELLSLEQASDLHAKRRDRLKQRPARSRRQKISRMGNEGNMYGAKQSIDNSG